MPALQQLQVKFATNEEDNRLIHAIVDRVMKGEAGKNLDRLDVMMDITAAHCNGCPLKLSELLGADDFNFSHDVFGIMRHIDRMTGKLTDFFTPRFAV